MGDEKQTVVTPENPAAKEEVKVVTPAVETPSVETPSVETPAVGTEKTPDGEQTPNKKDPIQARIDRMYARMKRAEAKVVVQPKPTVDDDDEDPEKVDASKIQDIVRQTIAQESMQQQYTASEKRVIENHPNCLNDDGTYDFNDPFVKAYVEIGRRNPQLAAMENGPELAAAMVEKELGIDYKRGRTDEAGRVVSNGHTSKTTVSPPQKGNVAQLVGKLTTAELHVAKMQHLTPEEYAEAKQISVIK